MPRFFTKKRAGSRGGAPGRAPQRAELSCANEAQEGVKGGTLAGEAQPELSKLAPLAAELGVSVDWLLSDAEPEEPRAEPERAEDWTDKLPRLLRGAARRWGWLAGVYLAVVGALFAGMGALARAVSRSMFESAASLDILTGGGLGGLAQSGMGLLMDASGQLAQFSRNNPVYLFGGVLLIFGLVLCAAGVVLAVVLRRMGRRGDK